MYPFFSSIFAARGFESGFADGVGMGYDGISFLMLGWNLTMSSARFGGESIGPLYLMGLPLLLFGIRQIDKRSFYLVLFALFYGVFVFFNSQLIRFFIPCLAIASLGVAGAIGQFFVRKDLLSRVGRVIIIAAILLEAGINGYHILKSARVLIGLENVPVYLEKYERSYLGYRFLNEKVPYGSKIFNAAEVRRFYNGQPRMVFSSVPLELKLKAQGWSLPDYLAAESFDYLWLSHDARKFFWDYARQHSYQKIFSYRFKEGPKVFVCEVLKKPS